ncbi:MAG: hypothetical protein EPO28_08095 [Saprospiraceae bacterium]|nr:MAG: hypothetical protein EPO28_08095 [Saprospiraceae bacterium]
MKIFPVLILIAACFCEPAALQAQAPNGWPIFEKVTFKKKFIDEFGIPIRWPVFDEKIRAWEGRKIMLTGYIIPTAQAGYQGVLVSKYTYNMCFFCGKAGLESVAEIRLKTPLRDFKIDKPYVFTGHLRLNDSDMNSLVFILEDAVLMEM